MVFWLLLYRVVLFPVLTAVYLPASKLSNWLRLLPSVICLLLRAV